MQNLILEKTNSSPFISFNAETGHLEIKGESYPENVAKFYTPVLDWIKAYQKTEPGTILLEFDIPYFNSSSSKVLMMILDLLEQGVSEGKEASVRWLCEKENDTAIECGEEFKEDLSLLQFEIELY